MDLKQETAEEIVAKGMKKCSTCGKDIAKTAKSCPSCGAKNRRPIYMNKFLWFVAAIALLIGFFNVKSMIDEGRTSVSINGEKFTISEFSEISNNNTAQLRSEYMNETATVTGKITEIKGGYHHNNLGKYIETEIIVEDEWHFVFSSNSSALSEYQVDDYITISGKITNELYGDIYCFENVFVH